MNDGGPAFPNAIDNSGGISVRDYFAAKAMNALIIDKDELGILLHKGAEWISEEAYRLADAMLKARTK